MHTEISDIAWYSKLYSGQKKREDSYPQMDPIPYNEQRKIFSN